MAEPAKKQLDPWVIGTTWEGIGPISVLIGGAAPSSALASVTMTFYPEGDASTASETLTSADSEITISGTYGFTVLPKVLGITAAGNYSWKIATTDEAGDVKVYLWGFLPAINQPLKGRGN